MIFFFSDSTRNERALHDMGNMGLALSPITVKKTKKSPAYIIRRDARQAGLPYSTKKGKFVPQKQFKMQRCNCFNNCSAISREDREKIFSQFWSSGSWQVRSGFILQTVTLSKPKRTTGPSSRKKMSRSYTLNNVKVCKTVYLSTLGISNKRVDYCLNKKGKQGICSPDKRGKSTPNKTSEATVTDIRNFLDNQEKFTSHYCSSEKKYFSPGTTVKQLHADYLKTRPGSKVSISIFKKVFANVNIKIYQPKTDTCKTCDWFAIELSSTDDQSIKLKLEAERELHHLKAESAQIDLRLAKQSTDPSVLAFTFDMQKTQPLPSLQTSIVFYKRQLWIYNTGIHNLFDQQGHMMLWTENEGKKGTNEVCSAILKYLEMQKTENVKKILTFSDTCGGQNRNKAMLSFIMFACSKFGISEWAHRYMQSGHSFLPNDRDFALIEKKKQRQPVFSLDDWIQVVESANTKKPFKPVKLAGHIKKISALAEQRQFKPRNDSGAKFNFLTLSWFRIKKDDDTIQYKSSDDPTGSIMFYTCPLKKNQSMLRELDHLPSENKISKAKYDDIKSLLPYIPPRHRPFFENLTYEV